MPAVNRKRSLSVVSQTEQGQDAPRSQKRICQPSPKINEGHVSLFDPTPPSSSVSPLSQRHLIQQKARSPSPPSPSLSPQPLPSPRTELNKRAIRTCIQHLMKDPHAVEKSKAQMDALLSVVEGKRDLLITMVTGGGKSMLWMVPSKLSAKAKSIVVCPFVSLLEEQYQKTTAHGLICHKYGQSKEVPSAIQILFVQVENCASEGFAKYVFYYLSYTFKSLSLVSISIGSWLHLSVKNSIECS